VLAGIIFLKPIVAFFTSGTLLPDFITNRMKSILALLNGEGAVGDVGARLYYYRFSILSLKNSKLIGSYILNSSPPGGHMAIIDLLAQCGLVVFTVYLFTTVRICRRVSETLGKDEKNIFILSWALYIFFGLINNIFFAPMFIVMVFVLPNSMLEPVHGKC